MEIQFDKYSENTKYTCNICNGTYGNSDDAIKCHDGHYKLGKIIAVYYTERGKKCPGKIQVELSLDGGESFEKDVFFEIVETGWGTK